MNETKPSAARQPDARAPQSLADAPAENRSPKTWPYVLIAIAAVIVIRVATTAGGDIVQAQQIMGGSYNVGSFKGVVGHLGGVPVRLPPGYGLFREYDGDPGFGEKRQGPVPPRTYESGLRSFGFELLFPEMKDNDWIAAGHADIFTSMWLDVGIQSNSAYFKHDTSMTRYANISLDLRKKTHRFAELPDKPYGLVGYTPLDPKPGARTPVWKLKPGENSPVDPDDMNIYFHYTEDGEVDTYIECGNIEHEAIGCDEEFLLTPEMKVRVTVHFRRGLLPHWREIKEGVSRTLLGFRVNPADGSPLVPPDTSVQHP
jgi:hypothetical protein